MGAVIISSPQRILEEKPQMSVWFQQNRIGAIPHARGRPRSIGRLLLPSVTVRDVMIDL